jgi:hypothetical protein
MLPQGHRTNFNSLSSNDNSRYFTETPHSHANGKAFTNAAAMGVVFLHLFLMFF